MLTIVFVLLCIIAIALFHSCKYWGNIHYIFKIYSASIWNFISFYQDLFISPTSQLLGTAFMSCICNISSFLIQVRGFSICFLRLVYLYLLGLNFTLCICMSCSLHPSIWWERSSFLHLGNPEWNCNAQESEDIYLIEVLSIPLVFRLWLLTKLLIIMINKSCGGSIFLIVVLICQKYDWLLIDLDIFLDCQNCSN